LAEGAATYFCLPSRVCRDRVGEKVGKSQVDRHGERVVLEPLPGAHWVERHDTMAHEVAALCRYSGITAEREPFGLFGHLIPQEALSRLQQNQTSQVLRPDLRLEIPRGRIRPPDRRSKEAIPADAPRDLVGPTIAEIKIITKGAKAHYGTGARELRAVDRRAKKIPQEYKNKAIKMDNEGGAQGSEGPCQRRLAEYKLMRLVWGALGEGSQDVHSLVAILAENRVRTLTNRGERPGPHQYGLEVSLIRRRLSATALRANSNCLLHRVSQIGEGSGMAAKRRELQRQEEQVMASQEESERIARTTGQEIVGRGMFWRG